MTVLFVTLSKIRPVGMVAVEDERAGARISITRKEVKVRVTSPRSGHPCWQPKEKSLPYDDCSLFQDKKLRGKMTRLLRYKSRQRRRYFSSLSITRTWPAALFISKSASNVPKSDSRYVSGCRVNDRCPSCQLLFFSCLSFHFYCLLYKDRFTDYFDIIDPPKSAWLRYFMRYSFIVSCDY